MQIANFNNFVAMDGDRLVTDSRKVAQAFNKQHAHVMRDIRKLFKIAPDFAKSNFGFSFEINGLANGKRDKFSTITKDGFMLLVMGYTGEKAMQIKIGFLNAFNAMREFIKSSARFSMQEAIDAEADLIAQNQLGSFHGRGLNRHKHDKPPKVKRLMLALESVQLKLI